MNKAAVTAKKQKTKTRFITNEKELRWYINDLIENAPIKHGVLALRLIVSLQRPTEIKQMYPKTAKMQEVYDIIQGSLYTARVKYLVALEFDFPRKQVLSKDSCFTSLREPKTIEDLKDIFGIDDSGALVQRGDYIHSCKTETTSEWANRVVREKKDAIARTRSAIKNKVKIDHLKKEANKLGYSLVPRER